MTQVSQVRRHLTAGKTITPMQAIAVYGIFRLASVIEDLRQEGMQIDCVLKYDEVGKQYGEYRQRQPITVGATVQVVRGNGIGLPRWVRSLSGAKVLALRDDCAFVRFVRGASVADHWMNQKELVAV